MAVLCHGLEKNSMVRAWYGHGMASVNQTRQHCVNQMGKAHSKPLAARQGMGTARAQHAMCELALSVHTCLVVKHLAYLECIYIEYETRDMTF